MTDYKKYILLDILQFIIALTTFVSNLILSYFAKGTNNEYIFLFISFVGFVLSFFAIADIIELRKAN